MFDCTTILAHQLVFFICYLLFGCLVVSIDLFRAHIFFYVSSPKEDFFLTTFYSLYLKSTGTYYSLQFLWASEGSFHLSPQTLFLRLSHTMYETVFCSFICYLPSPLDHFWLTMTSRAESLIRAITLHLTKTNKNKSMETTCFAAFFLLLTSVVFSSIYLKQAMISLLGMAYEGLFWN